jgi:hypothetical protein
MAKSEKAKAGADSETLPANDSPYVFISHDSRDAELAEAFGKLLKSVSAGMIKTFRSSDKKGTDGIDFGEEWYKRLMVALQSTSDVVCLFTERSVDRPWILFEAGVAKGKLNTPVIGVACGIALSRITAGPFYQFQNMDDSVEDLTKLIQQLARRVPGLELDADVVKAQVATFKSVEADILKKAGTPLTKKQSENLVEENPVAKLAEEMKALPSRVAERLANSEEPFIRRRRPRRFHPMMLEELMHRGDDPGDPVMILMAASLIREDAPWFYELGLEAYRAIKSGNPTLIEGESERLSRFSKAIMQGPFMEDFMMGDKETYMLMREFPHFLHHTLQAAAIVARDQRRRPSTKSTPEKAS